MEKISWDNLRKELKDKFVEMDAKAAGTVCRRCGGLILGIIDDEDWVQEVHTNIPVTFCYNCNNYIAGSLVNKDEDTFATEILGNILELCGLLVLQPYDDEVRKHYKVWAYEQSGDDEGTKA